MSNSTSSPVSLAVTSSQLSAPGSHSCDFVLAYTATSTITPYQYGPTSTTDYHLGHFPATCQASGGSEPPIGPRQQLALPASTNQEAACRPHNGPAEAIVYRCLMKLWSSGNFRVRELCSAKRGRDFPIWEEEGRSGRKRSSLLLLRESKHCGGGGEDEGEICGGAHRNISTESTLGIRLEPRHTARGLQATR